MSADLPCCGACGQEPHLDPTECDLHPDHEIILGGRGLSAETAGQPARDIV